ncbi:hypothetical protein [Geodermatophilus siccatus]|uniref:hypothetical protein n=1 Tax=Geodermatophilus siccatus TaxID=1137991 RepID=UPI001587405E|nr:hypothetical protein [Geodermatophilus siccatus]
MTSLQQAPAGLPGTGGDLLRPATPGEPAAVRALALDVAGHGTGPATLSRAAAG